MAEWCSSTSAASWFFSFSAFSRSKWIFSFSLDSLSTQSLTGGKRGQGEMLELKGATTRRCGDGLLTHVRCLSSALKLANAAWWMPFLVVRSSFSRATVRSHRLTFSTRLKFKA